MERKVMKRIFNIQSIPLAICNLSGSYLFGGQTKRDQIRDLISF